MIGSLKPDPTAWPLSRPSCRTSIRHPLGIHVERQCLDQDEAEANDIVPVGRETLAAPENVLETIASDANVAEGSLVDRQLHPSCLTSHPVGSEWSMLGSATTCRLNQDARRACSLAGSLMWRAGPHGASDQ